MFSRRRFLQAGAVAAGGVTTLSSPLNAQESPALPPSITNLKSMKDQARPITSEERGQRQEKAPPTNAGQPPGRAILLMEGTSLDYFGGVRWWGGERLLRWCCPRRGVHCAFARH